MKHKSSNHVNTGSSTQESRKLTQDHSRPSFDNPTPLDFDAFVPWVCLEWQTSEVVVVTRVIQEEVKHGARRSSSSRSKSTRSLKLKQEDLESTEPKKSIASGPSGATDFMTRSSLADNIIPIKAIYDTKGHLVEISIIACPFEIHRKIIKAISICIPFHSLLSKLTIRRGGVTNAVLYELGKMLPHSNLTDICLDDCIVPQGTYDIVFEQTSQLKYLSLNRCSIDDSTCKAIAAKIDIGCPGSSLLVLELASNLINDKGAKDLGESLRRNRRLLHLNLSGNKITDFGASSILSNLMEFKLTWNEIFDARQRKLKYTEKKMEVYASCYEEVVRRQQSEIYCDSARKSIKNKSLKSLKSPKEDLRKKSKKNTSSVFVAEKSAAKSAAEVAIDMTMDIVGNFTDPYDHNSVVNKDEHAYSKGNMVICSLNLAYNNLSFVSINQIYDVLKYQCRLAKSAGETGLLRLVFNGNFIPAECVEYDRIEMFLRKVVYDNTPVANPNAYHKKRTLSASVSKRF